MILFAVPRLLRTTAKRLIFFAVLAPTASFSQSELDTFAERERQISEILQQEQSQNGPYSNGLIAPLMELSLLYDDIGAIVRAEETIREVLTVIRANNGLESLEQVPLLRRLISRERERGNAAAAWDLETDLLVLADRNPADLRSAEIMREVGDYRIETLRLYDTGVIPPEIILGCFYDDRQQQEDARLRGSRPMNSMRVGPGRECRTGDKSFARRALLQSALRYYRRGFNIMRLNGASSSNEVPELLRTILDTSYLLANFGVGKQALTDLLDYESTYALGWLPRIEAQVQLADWDLLYASGLGTRYEQTALAKYQQAYDLLIEHEISQESMDQIFSPEIPVVLPSFTPNPLISAETSASRGFIDVSFVVTDVGKSKRINILETSENVERADERDLIHAIKYNRFRPRIIDGQFADSDPITVRYFLND